MYISEREMENFRNPENAERYEAIERKLARLHWETEQDGVSEQRLNEIEKEIDALIKEQQTL